MFSEVRLGGTCFLTDFTNELYGGLRNNLPGKKEYLLPEYWQGTLIIIISFIGFLVSCFSADVWAACVSLYVLIKGDYPFHLDNLELHLHNMTHYEEVPNMEGFSPELTDLLSRCLSPSTDKRLSINSILVTCSLVFLRSRIILGLVKMVIMTASPSHIRRLVYRSPFSYHAQPKNEIPNKWNNPSMKQLDVWFSRDLISRSLLIVALIVF